MRTSLVLFVLIFLFVMVQSAVANSTYIHCYTEKTDHIMEKNVKVSKSENKKYFCSRSIVNQNNEKYGEIIVDNIWTLVLYAKFPSMKWVLLASEDKFMEYKLDYEGLGTHFDLHVGTMRLHCIFDGYKCNTKKYENLNELELLSKETVRTER